MHFFIRITDKYEIPKGTFVFPNLYGLMHDENHFKNPETFDPRRFLAEKKNGPMVFQPDERVIPFSTGKRSCLGQTLAEKELFLFFTGLMQNFTFSLLTRLKSCLTITSAPLIHKDLTGQLLPIKYLYKTYFNLHKIRIPDACILYASTIIQITDYIQVLLNRLPKSLLILSPSTSLLKVGC